MKKKLFVLALFFAVVAFGLYSCKETDIVTITDDGWRIHSIVPRDTDWNTKNKQ